MGVLRSGLGVALFHGCFSVAWWENKVLVLFSATEQADIAFGGQDSSFAKKTILLSLIGMKLVPIVRSQRAPGSAYYCRPFGVVQVVGVEWYIPAHEGRGSQTGFAAMRPQLLDLQVEIPA